MFVFGYIIACVLFLLLLSFIMWITQRKAEIKGIPNRTVMVTGCDTGFGNLLAKSLDARGVRVLAGCLTSKGAQELEQSSSSRVQTFVIDITDRQSVATALEFVTKSLKGEGLWGLVNNAGVMPAFAPVEWTPMDDYEFTCKVNLFGTISVTKAFLPLVRRAQGRIVNVCSVTSQHAYPGISTYVISKAALKMFSICLRRELFNTGVSIHTIEPGGFQTNITNQQRIMDVFLKSYKTANPEAQDVYSGHIARHIYSGMGLVKQYISTNPQQVPDTMMHALFAKYPKQAYLVGMDAHLFFRFLRLTPNWVGDYILGWPQPYGPKLSILDDDVTS